MEFPEVVPPSFSSFMRSHYHVCSNRRHYFWKLHVKNPFTPHLLLTKKKLTKITFTNNKSKLLVFCCLCLKEVYHRLSTLDSKVLVF